VSHFFSFFVLCSCLVCALFHEEEPDSLNTRKRITFLFLLLLLFIFIIFIWLFLLFVSAIFLSISYLHLHLLREKQRSSALQDKERQREAERYLATKLINFLFLWNKNKKPKCHFFGYFSRAFRLLTNTPKTLSLSLPLSPLQYSSQ